MFLCAHAHTEHRSQDNEGEGGVAKPGKAAKPGSKTSAGVTDEAKAAKAAEKQRQAQLEMLMMDDNALQDLARIGDILSLIELVAWKSSDAYQTQLGMLVMAGSALPG